MASALENLLKILKLEKNNNYDNKGVIGGLGAYAPKWAEDARRDARTADQMMLIEEILMVIDDYQSGNKAKRQKLAQYMIDRLMRRADALPEYIVEEAPEDLPVPKLKPNQRHRESSWLHPDVRSDSDDVPPPPDPERDPRPFGEVIPKPRRRKRDPKKTTLENLLKTEAELQAPLTKIQRVGDKMSDKLNRLGVYTIGDLLYLFPRRYDDYTRMVALNRLAHYQLYTVIGTVSAINTRKTKRGDITVLTVSDGTASIAMNFFNQSWLRRQLKTGMQLVFSGKTDFYGGKIVMNNPTWEPVDQKSLQTGGIVPIYPLTKGISARTIRKVMKTVINEWADKLVDYLPESVLDRADQVDLGWAIRQVHFPERWEFIGYARERLAFDELLRLQLGVLKDRTEWQSEPAHPLYVSGEWLAEFQESLPFQLTNAQSRSVKEMIADIERDVPMNRLLQGDVGAGKTMVAAVGLAAAVINDKQSALMAPTSILAEQHYQKLSALYAEIPSMADANIALLTGSLSSGERQAVYDGLADGSIDIVVGTHAVIQEGVAFNKLALAVIDEQHRFGVNQRGALRGKGVNPHVLVMTATPIPRTLALTMYADLDLSILDELPPGRTPIQTRVLPPSERTKVHMFVEHSVLNKGHQAYVIYPLIEESEKLNARSATEGHQEIQNIYHRHKVGLMHGRMKPDEKEAVMEAFSKGELDVLVSTTVIEVGVDVPNATAMIIENAERFGLAQLHQLRGRVGRGGGKSYCMLISGEKTERLQALEDTTDGFKLAELDWQQRGAGDLLGVRQSGQSKFRFADQITSEFVLLSQQEAKAIYAEDPLLQAEHHAMLAHFVQGVTDLETDLS